MIVVLFIALFISGCLSKQNTFNVLDTESNDSGESHVFLISIDGLRADYLDHAEIKLPNLRKLISNGVRSDMLSVYPALTFPAHVTMITGVNPSKHGILANERFDPMNENKGLNLFAQDVKTETIFDAAKNYNIETSGITWPVTAFSKSIDYSLPDAPARTPTELSYYFNGCIKSNLFKKQIDNLDKIRTINDQIRFQLFKSLFEQGRLPRLNALHLVDFDHAEHVYGAFSKEAIEVLEKEDEIIGEIMELLSHYSLWDKSNVFVVSDHGFTNISHVISPGVLMTSMDILHDESSWKTAPYVSPGVFAIYVNENLDVTEKKRMESAVSNLVDFFYSQREKYGIHRAFVGYDKVKSKNLGGFSGAFAILESVPGYWFSPKTTGLLLENMELKGYLGTHGYNPKFKEMSAVFIASGRGIVKNKTLTGVKMVDIAPIISHLLGLNMKGFDGNIPEGLFVNK